MKRFIWLLVLVAAGYAAWKHYPEIERRARELTSEAASLVSEEPPPAAPKAAAPEDKAASSPAADKKSSPSPAAGTAAPSASVQPAKSREEEEFPELKFKPLEELVGNWKAIPRSAFPRQVKLKKDLTFTLTARGQGSARFEAGAQVYALGAEGDTLLLATSQEGLMRAKARIDDTNFKEVLAEVYEQFKQRRREEVRRQRAEAAASGGTLKTVLKGDRPSPAMLAKIGPQPQQQPDGKVPVMLASIAERRRQKKDAEPAPEDITAWKGITYREINGEPYWCGALTYTTRTIFGEFPTEAHALIRHGKVVQWLYAGTNEPLP